MSEPDPELLVGVPALVEHLNKRGYKISRSMASKLTMPSNDRGPPREGYFGNLPCFDPQKAVAWYRGRMTPDRSLLFQKRRPKSEEERRIEQKRRRELSRTRRIQVRRSEQH
jgi:hypothetical protein